MDHSSFQAPLVNSKHVQLCQDPTTSHPLVLSVLELMLRVDSGGFEV